MQFWLITIGEPLPVDGDNVRLYRTGLLANLLVEKGHNVLWWTSTYDHFKKKHRFFKDSVINVNDNLRIKLLYSIKYKRNVSLRRIINHYIIAHKFLRSAAHETKPDIILCSFPTIHLSFFATKYGKMNDVPVVLDTRDMWPETFLNLVPNWIMWFFKLLMLPAYIKTRKSFREATAITGMTSAYVEWALKYIKRKKTKFDKEFPFGYNQSLPDKIALKMAEEFWDNFGVNKESNDFIVCFFGTIGRQFELNSIIEAARILKKKKLPFRFILCGNGDKLNFYKRIAYDCKNITFPGWVNKNEIWALMRMASVGLAPYKNTKDFYASIPNKIIEYFSSGLPIISSLKGVVSDILKKYKCGLTYENNNVNDFLEKLQFLYNSPDLQKKMSKNAFILYKEKFTVKEVYNKMINYLEYIYCDYYGKKISI